MEPVPAQSSHLHGNHPGTGNKTTRARVTPGQRHHGTKDQIRRSRPKKGGGGGKGTWGRPGDEMNETLMDQNDPNYDASNEGPYYIEEVLVELTIEELEKHVKELMSEYFENGDVFEVVDCLTALNFESIKSQLVVIIMTIAFDAKDPCRELTSILLSELYSHVLLEPQIEKGFLLTMDRLEDIKLDVPDAPILLAKFMARAVADDVIPPKFLTSHLETVSMSAKAALEEANVLLQMKHGLVRLSEIWGKGGGLRPVKLLRDKMQLLLEEYLSSADKEEAHRCLLELSVPHFHHEFVYDGIVLVLDKGEHERNMLISLFTYLGQATVVTSSQMLSGFERVVADLHDISLDSPNAYTAFHHLAETAAQLKLIPASFVSSIPNKTQHSNEA